MKALEVQGPGGLADLKFVERPDPIAGHGEIVVRIKATTLNYRDLLNVSNGGRSTQPFVPMSDGAGVVEAVGPGVTRWKVGDRVTSLFLGELWSGGRADPSGLRFALGGPARDGCAQELLLIDQNGVVATPDYLSDAESAAYTCAGVTAWRAIVVNAVAKAGGVAVMLGTGGVSVFGLQIAHAMGMETIITSSSDAKLERCKALGATHVINYAATPEWGEAVRELTGRGADVVVEVGGPNTMPQSFRAVAIDGAICAVGAVGPVPEGKPFPVARRLMGTGVRLYGSMVGSRQDHLDLMSAFSLQGLKPVVDITLDWSEAHAAFEMQRAGKHFGKIALTL
jgi:NADPH:quinone reductase-like Zn-dependent oxidoreductase